MPVESIPAITGAATAIPTLIFENMPTIWTYLLLVVRYTALFLIIPGVGGGMIGLSVRMPAIMVFAYVTVLSSPLAPLPTDGVIMLARFVSELLFGFTLGLIPVVALAGVQTAAQLTSGTMGLGAAQLLDPNLGVSVSSLGRILTDSCICLFLVVGGHYSVLYAASGLGQIIPGTFMVEAHSIKIVIQQIGYIFDIAIMISAPVIVALLLTQFVMGLISKAVPTVNIFIVSFPLTIGIGLIFSMLSLPEIFVFMERRFDLIDKTVVAVTESNQFTEAELKAP